MINYKEQLDASEWMFSELVEKKEKSIIFSSKAGNGKTFVVGHFLKKSIQHFISLKDELSVAPAVIILTKDNAVPQTEDVLFGEFKLPANEILITNYEHLRSGEGLMKWINEDVEIKWGKEFYSYNWKLGCSPSLLIADEYQTVINPEAKITRIVASFLETKGQFLGMSATVASRVMDLMIPFISYEIS